MRMGMGLYQAALCVLCDQSITDHDPDCPQYLMECLADKASRHIRCPICPGHVGVNTSDWWECDKCHAQFTRAAVAPGVANVDKLPRLYLLDMKNDSAIQVVQLPERGNSKFKYDANLKVLRDLVKQRRREKKRKK